jgi:hypothetical protein
MNVETQDLIMMFPNQLDRQLIELECAHDPNFEVEVVELLQQVDGLATIIDSARKAIINDIHPGYYPEMEASWPMLRNVARDIYDKISKTQATPRSYGSPGLSDLGQDFSGIITAIAPILGTLASAGASAYAANQQKAAQQEIAQEQLQANMAEIKAQEAMAAAQTAIANNQTQQAVSSVLPPVLATPIAGVINAATAPVFGIPVWTLGLLAWFLSKK